MLKYNAPSSSLTDVRVLPEKTILAQTGVTSGQLREVFQEKTDTILKFVDVTADKFANSMLAGFGCSAAGVISIGLDSFTLSAGFLSAALGTGGKGIYHLMQNRAVGNVTKKALAPI